MYLKSSLPLCFFSIGLFNYCYSQDSDLHPSVTIKIRKAVTEKDTNELCILYIRGMELGKFQAMYGNTPHEVNCKIKKGRLLHNKKLELTGCSDSATIISFTFRANYNSEGPFGTRAPIYQGSQTLKASDAFFIKEMIYWIKKLGKGCTIDFEDVVCENKNGETMTLQPITVMVY